MKYVTGIYALNLKSPDGTPGDWHYGAIDWSNIQLCETEDSPFGTWGLYETEIPCHEQMLVANHVRACLDLIAQGFFSSAGGMREYFISDDSFNDLIFEKVWQLRGQDNWEEINDFMGKEYLCDWLDFKETMVQTERQKAIDSFLHFINSDGKNPFILKGSTALAQCYQLDRLTEDIYFDAEADTDHNMLLDKAQEFCDEFGFLFRVDEDTLTTQRTFINYKSGSTPLKVEVSYRRKSIPQDSITCINDIRVYDINELAALAAIAYGNQNKIQDLYDLLFICTRYIDDLTSTTKNAVCRALEYKDLDQFDYLVRTQNDPLIDKAKLEAMFVKTFDAVGLVAPTRSAHIAPATNKAQGSKERDVQEQRIRHADGKPIAIDSRDKKTNTSSNPDERIRYADVKPISIVDSLDDLKGPVSGEIKLPLSIYWGPGDGVFSLDEPGDLLSIYQAVLSEGKLEDLSKFLNKDILIEMWPDLSLPIRVAKMWQAKYPIDLKGNARADR